MMCVEMYHKQSCFIECLFTNGKSTTLSKVPILHQDYC